MFFIKSNTFRNSFEIKFDKKLNGIKANNRGFHSTYLIDGPENDEIYNGWNFTDNRIWDALTNESFWYNPSNAIVLQTASYIIGKQQSEKSILNLVPQKFTFKQKKVVKYFPPTFEDEVIKIVAYSPNTNVNNDGRTPIHEEEVDSSDQSIQLNFEYTEQRFTIKYVGVMDIVSRVGGYVASFLPLMNILGPLLVLQYLRQLSEVLRLSSV